MTLSMPQTRLESHDQEACIILSGDWRLSVEIPDPSQVTASLDRSPEISRLTFDCQALGNWDSSLAAYLFTLQSEARSRDMDVDLSTLPAGLQHLLSLADSGPDTAHVSAIRPSASWTALLSNFLGQRLQKASDFLNFLGQSVLAASRLMAGRRCYRRQDIISQLSSCGVMALPIISLISILVGLILAFVGAVQLKYFGAQIYVADLVGIAMTREMGAMMTGIIMAGRTGAAFAAQLGTMQVNEEIDALQTFGIQPFDFLVLPRILALVVMMPLLCIYADVMGMLGGAVVGLGMLDITPPLYWNQTVAAITLPFVWLGLVKSCVFGFLVGLVGCLRGMQAGRSAEAVGRAATSAVVTSIVGIIVVDGLFAVLCNILGI